MPNLQIIADANFFQNQKFGPINEILILVDSTELEIVEPLHGFHSFFCGSDHRELKLVGAIGDFAEPL